MGKTLIKIHTRVRVQLHLTNHCRRPLSVRILHMGPRLQGRILTPVARSPPGAAWGQGSQPEHLQGKRDLWFTVLCNPVLPTAPRPPFPNGSDKEAEGMAVSLVVAIGSLV